MGKYKVGDRVRVRSDMTVGETYGLYLNSSMNSYAGIETRILDIDDDNYTLKIDNGRFYWSEIMLEPVSKFKVGDRVRIKVRTGRQEDYPCDFINDMTDFSGKEFQIASVDMCTGYRECKYYEEPFKYRLTDVRWIWSSPMLELVASANEITSVISDRCDTASGSISVADYAIDCASLITSSSFTESKPEYVPSYKLETQNNYNLNFNLK